jgi:hypothetical protein
MTRGAKTILSCRLLPSANMLTGADCATEIVRTTEAGEAVELFCKDIRDALRQSWISPEEHTAQEKAVALQRAEDERKQQEVEEKRQEEEARKRVAAARERERADQERRHREEEQERCRAEEQRQRDEAQANRRAEEDHPGHISFPATTQKGPLNALAERAFPFRVGDSNSRDPCGPNTLSKGAP